VNLNIAQTGETSAAPVQDGEKSRVQTADNSPTAPGKWDFKFRSPRVVKIENALKQTSEVNFTDIPLKDTLDFLEETHEIQMVVDAQSLSDVGKSTDLTVNLPCQELASNRTSVDVGRKVARLHHR